MKRSGPPARRTRLRANPATTRAWRERSRRNPGNTIPQASRDAVKLRSQGNCEARLPGCTLIAQVMHHRAPRRSRDHSPANLLHACRVCHTSIHLNPERSYRLGHLIRGA